MAPHDETESDSDTESRSDTGTCGRADPGADSEAESQGDPEPHPRDVTGPVSEAESQGDPESHARADTETRGDAGPRADAETRGDAETRVTSDPENLPLFARPVVQQHKPWSTSYNKVVFDIIYLLNTDYKLLAIEENEDLYILYPENAQSLRQSNVVNNFESTFKSLNKINDDRRITYIAEYDLQYFFANESIDKPTPPDYKVAHVFIVICPVATDVDKTTRIFFQHVKFRCLLYEYMWQRCEARVKSNMSELQVPEVLMFDPNSDYIVDRVTVRIVIDDKYDICFQQNNNEKVKSMITFDNCPMNQVKTKLREYFYQQGGGVSPIIKIDEEYKYIEDACYVLVLYDQTPNLLVQINVPTINYIRGVLTNSMMPLSFTQTVNPYFFNPDMYSYMEYDHEQKYLFADLKKSFFKSNQATYTFTRDYNRRKYDIFADACKSNSNVSTLKPAIMLLARLQQSNEMNSKELKQYQSNFEYEWFHMIFDDTTGFPKDIQVLLQVCARNILHDYGRLQFNELKQMIDLFYFMIDAYPFVHQNKGIIVNLLSTCPDYTLKAHMIRVIAEHTNQEPNEVTKALRDHVITTPKKWLEYIKVYNLQLYLYLTGKIDCLTAMFGEDKISTGYGATGYE